MTEEKMLTRIAEIDAMFESANGWGSWMITAANDREALVNTLNKAGRNIEHKHQARLASGKRTD